MPESQSENDSATWKNTPAVSVYGVISYKPKLDFSSNLWDSKEDIASFPWTPRSSKTDTVSYINYTRENRRKYANCAGNSTRFFPLGDHLHTDCLLSSLWVDLYVYNFKKEDTFSYNVQLMDFKDLPQSSQNPSRKMILQHGKTLRQPLFTGSYLTSPSSTSLEICETPKKTSQAFHGHQDHRKPTL